jgi:hypothetical protein
MGRPLAKLTFCKAMLAARCVEHQIEAAAIDTLGGHLHPGSAGEFHQSTRAHARMTGKTRLGMTVAREPVYIAEVNWGD